MPLFHAKPRACGELPEEKNMTNRVAEEVVAYCTSCRMDLTHVIVAMAGDKIVRVLCRSCNKEHAYRIPKELRPPAPKKRGGKPPIPRKTRSALRDWEKAMEGCQDLPAKAYAQDGVFEAGDKVNHSRFGLGVVAALIKPNKMEVLFQGGGKVLVRGS